MSANMTVPRTALIIEDQILIALEIQQMLEEFGVPDIRVERWAEHPVPVEPHGFDLAIIEGRLGAEHVRTLANDLKDAGTGVIVTSADGAVSDAFPGLVILEKPFTRETAEIAFRQAISAINWNALRR
jgi:hypothetical protein